MGDRLIASLLSGLVWAGLGACERAGNGDLPTLAIPTHDPVINAKRAACFHMDNLENRYDFSGRKVYRIQLDEDDYPKTERMKNPQDIKSRVITNSPAEADTYLFWDFKTGNVGYYSGTGAKAYYANISFCLIDRDTDMSSRFTISSTPPQVAKLSGLGPVTVAGEVYDFTEQWLDAKFGGRPGPEPTGRLRVSEWHPCPPLDVLRDDNLQRREPLSDEALKASCFSTLETGWGR